MKRLMKTKDLKPAAEKIGLAEGIKIIILERSMLKNGAYITREIRRGIVKALYPYHFICQMEDDTRESFRYNEILGNESRWIYLWKDTAENCAS